MERLGTLLLQPSPYHYIMVPETSTELTREDFRKLETIFAYMLQPGVSETGESEESVALLKGIYKRLKDHLYLEEDFERVGFTLTRAEAGAIQDALNGFEREIRERCTLKERDIGLAEVTILRQQFACIQALLDAQQEVH